MIELELSIKVLNSILYENLSFKKALKTHLPMNKSGQVTLTSGLVGCELRHHLFFVSLLKNEYSNDQKCAIYLALANHFFYKRISSLEITEMLNNHLKDVSLDEVFDLLKNEKSPMELIEFENNSVEFTSIRFNTPLWLTKMWKKHYGSGALYKILKANNKPNSTYVKIDNCLNYENFKELHKENCEFIAENNVFKLSPKASYRSFEEFKNNQLIPINMVEIEIFDKHQNDLVNEFTIYSGNNDSFVENFIISLSNNIGINVVVPDLSSRSSLLRFIRLRNAKNINLFAAHDEVSMRCGISHKQEIIYCYPSSTSFNKIASYPDYLLHINREDLDKYISLQKEALENCSKFVMDDGLLIYIVDTLSKKESIGIINDFLSRHKEFILLEEKQYFPFENKKTSLFYATLKLKGVSND